MISEFLKKFSYIYIYYFKAGVVHNRNVIDYSTKSMKYGK